MLKMNLREEIDYDEEIAIVSKAEWDILEKL